MSCCNPNWSLMSTMNYHHGTSSLIPRDSNMMACHHNELTDIQVHHPGQDRVGSCNGVMEPLAPGRCTNKPVVCFDSATASQP